MLWGLCTHKHWNKYSHVLPFFPPFSCSSLRCLNTQAGNCHIACVKVTLIQSDPDLEVQLSYSFDQPEFGFRLSCITCYGMKLHTQFETVKRGEKGCINNQIQKYSYLKETSKHHYHPRAKLRRFCFVHDIQHCVHSCSLFNICTRMTCYACIYTKFTFTHCLTMTISSPDLPSHHPESQWR